jgi:hypothetical protein
MTTATAVSTQEIANFLVEQCRQGNYPLVKQTYYSPDIISIESMAMEGCSKELKGLDAVMEKGKQWAENTEVHSQQVSEPMVAGNQFAVKFTMDMTCKQTNQRMQMEEIALYFVENDKIVREQFIYDTCQG